MNNKILLLNNIEKTYNLGVEELHILKNLNLEVKEGEFVSILGRSGSGKSTFLNILGLLDKVDSGEIFIDNINITTLSDSEKNIIKNKKLGFVFQFHYLLSEFTALENVMLPAMTDKSIKKDEIKEKAISLLKRVGLEHRINHKPNQLSGGEKQRVAIARALINSPKILLADEPTGNLDDKTSDEIFSLFKELNSKYNQTIVVVTHSKDLADLSHRQLYLKNGILTLEK